MYRYLGLTDEDRKQMLTACDAATIDDLYSDAGLLAKTHPQFNIPQHQGEIEVERHLVALAAKNISAGSGGFFLGAGCYRHHIPASVDHLLQRSEFLTSYTPYQPEISQGTLTYIFEFQSIIASMTGMEVANASMYDGATALAEAVLMAERITGKKGAAVALKSKLHSDYESVLNTYLNNHDARLFTDCVPSDISAIIVQRPDFYGEIADLAPIRTECDRIGALLIVVVNEILSLGLIDAPSSADIVVGDAASIGVGMNFGGPSLGFFASHMKYVRQMPGRICGQSLDKNGKTAYVLTLNAREQHIRREKATSNICTNQGLCALAFTIHASLLGELGMTRLARLNHERAIALADAITTIPGVSILNESFFNEFRVRLPISAVVFASAGRKRNINAGYVVGENELLLCATELTTPEDIAALVNLFNDI